MNADALRQILEERGLTVASVRDLKSSSDYPVLAAEIFGIPEVWESVLHQPQPAQQAPNGTTPLQMSVAVGCIAGRLADYAAGKEHYEVTPLIAGNWAGTLRRASDMLYTPSDEEGAPQPQQGLTPERVEQALWGIVEAHGKPEWFDSNEDFVEAVMQRLTGGA